MGSNVDVLELTGIFGGSQALEFRQDIARRMDAGTEVILLDCGGISFMDSSGLGALVVALKNVRAKNGQLFLCAIPDQVKMLLDLTSMDKVFRILKDQQEFETTIRPTLT